MNNMLPFGEPGEMGTASSEALCFHTLYALVTFLVFAYWESALSFLLDASNYSSLAAKKSLVCLNRSIFWNRKMEVKLIVSRPMLNNVEKHFRAWATQTLLLRIFFR